MSKEKLIELIKLDDYDLKEWLYNVGVDEARETFIQAMKDVEQETKNGCADVMPPIKCRNGYPSPWISIDKAMESCLNYQDKDLAGL